MSANRREDRSVGRHTLTVKALGDHQLRVICTCGMVVGGKRYTDRTSVTLTDLLELVRLHSPEAR